MTDDRPKHVPDYATPSPTLRHGQARAALWLARQAVEVGSLVAAVLVSATALVVALRLSHSKVLIVIVAVAGGALVFIIYQASDALTRRIR